MTARITTLPSGLTIATEYVPSALSVAIGAWVAVGARDEPDEHAGASHFLEHLVFKGTESRTAQDISRSVDRRGGDINAFTGKEYTAYYCRLPLDEAAFGVALVGDLVSSPALRDPDVETERQVILEELAMDDDEPEDVAHRLLAEALYPEHPLGRETAGSRETVEAMTADELRAFHRSRYTPGSTVVAVTGAVDHEHMVAAAAGAFEPMVPGERRERGSGPGLPRPGAVRQDDDTEQVQYLLGMRAFPREDPDREAFEILVHVLGGGMSSRLFDQVRERRGLAYSVYAAASQFDDAGAMTIYAGTMPNHLDAVREIVDHELDVLRTDGITEDELDVAIGSLTGSFVLGLEDTGSRMARLATSLTTMGRIRSVEDQLVAWRNVTLDDVRRVAERVLGGARIEVTVGPS
ncbi:MAG: pitrilysin family protein [Ilumatobacteraceae bacterium]